MPKINDLTTRPGGPQPTDEFWLASAGGAADFKANFNALLQFVASNMSEAQVNSLLKHEVAITVSNTGSVSNLPGRLPISGSYDNSNQTFTLTCPTGYVWHTAVASGNNLSESRTVTVNGHGTQELNVVVFNQSGNTQGVSFYLMGALKSAG